MVVYEFTKRYHIQQEVYRNLNYFGAADYQIPHHVSRNDERHIHIAVLF